MKTPALGQQVQYVTAWGEARPAKVIGIRHLPGYPVAVATIEVPEGWNFEVSVETITWEEAPTLDRDELEILLDLAEVTESDMRDGALSGTSWTLEDITALVAKLKILTRSAL